MVIGRVQCPTGAALVTVAGNKGRRGSRGHALIGLCVTPRTALRCAAAHVGASSVALKSRPFRGSVPRESAKSEVLPNGPAFPRRIGVLRSAVTFPDITRPRVLLRPAPEHQRVRMTLWLLVAIVVGLTLIGAAISKPSQNWLNLYLAIAWSLYAPVGVIGIAGALLNHPGGYIDRSRFTGRTQKQVIFNVPSMCQANTTNALRRVLRSIVKLAPANLDHWRIDVVTEEGKAAPEVLAELYAMPNVQVLIVPADYKTPDGAAYKTRANHYAMEARRRAGENTESTYVYHLDDDTHVGPDTIASLAEFIHRHHGDRYLAQGILAFPRELTPSTLAWYCDAIRPADDATRFAFFTGWLGRPLAGLHGEHVIIRADIEDEIGWDFRDTVIEDAYFALQFSIRYPGRATTLNSFSYGASPSSVDDLIRQRRRWAEGLLRLICKRSLPWRVKAPLAYTVLCWVSGPFQFVGVVLLLAALTGTTPAPPLELVTPVWAFSMGSLMWQYTQGLKLNMAASARQRPTWWRSALCMPGLWIFFGIEAYGSMLGMLRFLGIGRQRQSEVIAKPL